MTKKLILLLTLGLVATLTPVLADPGSNDVAESVAAQAEAAPAEASAVSEASATETAGSFASVTPVMAALSELDLPIFRTVLDTPRTSVTITCDLCNTHTDCIGICPGEPAVNFVCSRHFNSCYGWGPKVCICA